MLWILCIFGLASGLLVNPSLIASGREDSVVVPSSPAQYTSQPYSNFSKTKNQSYDQIPDVYMPFPSEERGACSITDKYCSYNGTARNPDGLKDQCLLWDDTCSGNQTLATEKFFGQTKEFLYENVCFTAEGDGSVQTNCTRQNTPARFAEFQRIKDWMRSPQCIASQGAYQKAHPAPDTEGMQGAKRGYEKRDNSTEGHKYGGGTCCGTCNIEAGNVDVYYWPAPNANQSCLSIIGDRVNSPDYGATTDSLGLKYWGCTTPLTGIPGESVRTITTASVMVTGSRSWKAYLENPWDPSLCPTTSSTSPGSNGSVKARALDGQIYARGHTLVVPASVTGNDGSPVTTVVSANVTFTSPSVYAAFTSIGAYDSCGGEIISTTMLSFAPGELSTVVGPRYFGNIAATTLPFNFADLPCPPYSVAYENYYKPAPGEPYRPLIAIPSQVRSMIPWFQYCTDLWFTGFDPPKTLVPAAAMAPPVTTTDPTDHIGTPQASTTQDPGAKKTAAVWDSVPLPPPLQPAPLPKETNQVPTIKPQTPQIKPVEDPGVKDQGSSQQGSGSTYPSGSMNIQSSGSEDSQNPGDPSGESNIQAGSSGSSNIPGDSNQDGSKDPPTPAHNQGANPTQVVNDPTSQHSPQNQITDPGAPTPKPDITLAVTTMSLASHAVVVDPSGVHVDGVKVDPNQAPASISAMVAIYQGNSIVVASQIVKLSGPTEQVPTTIAGQTIVPVANGISIQGTTVTGIDPVIISGTTVSVDKSHLYIGSKLYPLPTANPAPVTTLVNGVVALPMSNAVSIYGTTLTAGAPAATFSGTAVSLDSSSNLLFEGTAQTLPSLSQTKYNSGQVTTINNVAVELLSSGISVAGTTLTPGAPAITASGSPISLGSKILAIGTSSVPVSFGNSQTLITTIGGQTITAAATAVEIGRVTLSPGAQGTTIGGILVSLGSGGSFVVGSQTVMLGEPSGSLGGFIMGGFGSGVSLINSSSPSRSTSISSINGTNSGAQVFEGSAAHLKRLIPESLAGLAIAIHLILYFRK